MSSTPISHGTATVQNFTGQVPAVFQLDASQYSKMEDTLNEAFSGWCAMPGVLKGGRKDFYLSEEIATSSLCAALDAPMQSRSNKPLADLMPGDGYAHELKCLSYSRKDVHETIVTPVLTRTAYCKSIRDQSPEDALKSVVDSLNDLISAREAECPKGVLIHYFLYNGDNVVHFAKPLKKMDHMKMVAYWKDKDKYSTLMVSDKETGAKLFGYTVNGSKVQFHSVVPNATKTSQFKLKAKYVGAKLSPALYDHLKLKFGEDLTRITHTHLAVAA